MNGAPKMMGGPPAGYCPGDSAASISPDCRADCRSDDSWSDH
jgi:hypothetical protein